VYRRSVRINLAKFFHFTGAGLVVVAAGVLAYGFHDLQEAGYLTFGGLDRVVIDGTGILPPSSWWGSLWKGLFSISAAPTRVELAVWLAYLVPTMVLFLRPSRETTPGAPSIPSPTPTAAGAGAGGAPRGAAVDPSSRSMAGASVATGTGR